MRTASSIFAIVALVWAAPAAAMIPVAGDVNEDGVVDARDIQIVINVVLGLAENPNTDITQSGTTDARDIQLVINAVLGIEIDSTGNGLADVAAENLGADPNAFDTSGDGIPDGVAVALDMDPTEHHEVDAEIAAIPSAASLAVGDTLPLDVVSDFPYYDVTWEVEQGNGAVDLDEDNVVTALREGEAGISATDAVSGSSATASIAVLQELTPEVPARKIEEIQTIDYGADPPIQVAVLEDGSRFALDDVEYTEYFGERAPDLSERSREKFHFFPFQFPLERVSLDAWQTPIKHQQDRRTCVVHAVLAAVEAKYKRAGYGELNLSEQFAQHMIKTTYLYDWEDPHDPDEDVQTQDGWENQLGLGGGGNTYGALSWITEYRVPKEQYAPYEHSNRPGHGWADYERTNQEGDDPRVHWRNRTGAVEQAMVNDFNMQQEEVTVQVPGDMTFTPLPQEAIENAVYGITGHVRVPDSQIGNPAWYEHQLAFGREIVATFHYNRTTDDHGIIHPRDREEGEGPNAHAMLIVGYDRTDSDNPYFIVKNSWGEDGYIKLSYDWAEGDKDGRIVQAAYLTGVATPGEGAYHPTRYIGGWRLVRDGEGGLLDIHRRSQYYDGNSLSGLDDHRLGAFFRPTEPVYRVNGVLGANGEAEFYIDDDLGNLSYDALEGDHHEAHLHPDKATLMAGFFEDNNGANRPFYANKGEHWQGVARFEGLSHTSFLGQWEIHSAAADGFVHIDGVNETEDTFAGASVSPDTPGGEFFMAMQGSADPVTQEIAFTLPSSDWVDESASFEGQIHANSPGTISGLAAVNGETYPMVLIRTGPATANVTIQAPEPGATFAVGETIPLVCKVTEDGIPVEDPHVIWTLGGPLGEEDMHIGSGASTATKRGAGEHTIYANYVGQDVYDQVTIVVQSAEQPDVTIHSPEDGEFIHYPYDIPNIHVDCAGSASSPQGNHIVSLKWYYREEGDTEWIDSGETGSEVTLILPDTSIGNMFYELKLEATDSQGNVGLDVISFSARAWMG